MPATKGRLVVRVLYGLFLLGLVGFGTLVSAQQQITAQHEIPIRRATVNFRELARKPIQHIRERSEANENEQTPPGLPLPPGANVKMEMRHLAQPQPAPAIVSPAPALSFLAVPDNNMFIPPDTNGAVGLNYLVVTLNGTVQIQDRNGNVISLTTLLNFWSPFAPFSQNPFDPRILYDPYAQRFIFISDANGHSTSTSILVAVSETNDPTGNWFEYEIPADTTGTLWADYPSVGFNKDWIVLAANMFMLAGTSFQSSNVYILPKAALYSGSSFTYSLFSGLSEVTLAPAVTYDPTASLSTMYLIDRFNGNFSGSGYLELLTVTGPVGSETLTTGVAFPSTPNPWADVQALNWLPQSGTANGIDRDDDRMMNVVYRNGSLWCVHAIFLPATGPNRSAIQWWQLGTDGTVQQRGVIDDASGTLFRDYPSIAVNQFSDVLIGYSLFSSSIFASAAYSFRSSTLALDTTESEVVLKDGLAPYFKTFSGTRNRWGDYSYTQVDPLNDTDLWTIQEYADSPANHWGTWWGKIAAPLATHFQLNAPVTIVAGTAFSVTVTALDSRNNPTADYTGTVHFTSSDGLATLPVDSTLANGTGTFTVVLRTAGNQALTATDTVNGTINGSATVSVSAGAATHLSIQTSASALAGSPFSLRVNALDQFNNLATSYTNTVHFTSSDGLATVPVDSTLANGTGTFTVVLRTAGNQTLTATDTVNGTINGNATVSVSAGPATHFAIQTTTNAVAGTPFGVTVTAVDQFNNLATSYASTVHFTSSDGLATLPVDSTLANGTGIFSVTLRTAGTQALTARDTLNGAINGSTTVSVSAGTATHFTIQTTTNAVAGTPFSVTVKALDQFNNPATSYTNTVHFTSSDGLATLPVDSTLANGTGTFSVVLRTAGNQALRATDTVNGTINGSTTVSVSAGTATRLAILTPSTATKGVAFSGTVHAFDQSNNPATTYTATVHFTSSDAAAVLPPDYVFTSGASGDNGSHTFLNGVVLNSSGPQTVTVSDPASLVATSAPIMVRLASATNLVSSLNPVYFRNAIVTFIATVSGVNGAGIPTGSVNFYDGNSFLGTASLNAGVAGLTVANLRIGSHAITASYAGDSNFAGSNSQLLVQRRSPAPRIVP